MVILEILDFLLLLFNNFLLGVYRVFMLLYLFSQRLRFLLLSFQVLL